MNLERNNMNNEIDERLANPLIRIADAIEEIRAWSKKIWNHVKRIKHRDLTHYFLRPHEQLPRAYLDSCEKFFKSIKQQASSSKHQAAGSRRDPDFLKKDLDSHKIL